MKPFRFFFGVSLALILFFFLARFVIWAMIAAAIMSIVFHLSRKVMNFFRNLSWEENDHYRGAFRNQYEFSPRYSRTSEELFYNSPKKKAEFFEDYRTITVR